MNFGLAQRSYSQAIDLGAATVSRTGRFQVYLQPLTPVPQIGELHSWALRIERSDHSAATLRGVKVDGLMPQHGHGLPTQPRLLPGTEPGTYRVNGVRFNMAGRWLMAVYIADSRGFDAAYVPFVVGGEAATGRSDFSAAELPALQALTVDALGPLPADPSNAVAELPLAVKFGHELFFDPGLSRSGTVACSSCHQPTRAFTDGRQTGRGLGELSRNTPSLIGIGYAKWFFADGRRDSLWSQALVPLEAAAEMGSTRLAVVAHVAQNGVYLRQYRALFGPLPADLVRLFAAPSPRAAAAKRPTAASPVGDAEAQAAWEAMAESEQEAVNHAFANIGKALAAYERQLRPGVAPFDRYVRALAANHGAPRASPLLSPLAVSGLKLFMDPGNQCLRCHNGPLFSNGGFHNISTGMSLGPHPDFGRSVGIMAVFATEFNCRGPYSDDPSHNCPELAYLDRHAENSTLAGAYKVPSLRNVAVTGPYMHDGRFKTLHEVMEHYHRPAHFDQASEFRPLADTSPSRLDAIAEFLRSLSAPVAAPAQLLRPPPPLTESH